MNNHTSNYSQSVKVRLLNLSRQENIGYQQLVTRYFQERLLFRLSQSKFRSHFVLKGGALLYAYEKFAARPTKSAFRSICEIAYEKDGVTFLAETLMAEEITVEKEYPVLLPDFPTTSIMAYSLETVVAEKFQTMVERTTFNIKRIKSPNVWNIRMDAPLHHFFSATTSSHPLNTNVTSPNSVCPLVRSTFSSIA